jgi:hypothetical protein
MFRESHAVMGCGEKVKKHALFLLYLLPFFTVTCHGVTLRPYPSKVLCLYINEMTFHLQISSENHASAIRFISLIYSVLQNTSIALRFVKIFRSLCFSCRKIW